MPHGFSRRSYSWLITATLSLLPLGGCRAPDAPPPVAVADWVDRAEHANRFVTVNGIALNYLDWGGQGEPLVLLHGMSDNAHAFDDLATALASHFRVLAYTRRGHGRSGKSGPYDVATLTEDLRELMDSLAIAKAHLAGWSFGGNEITAFAGKYPDRVDHLVYLDAAYNWDRPEWDSVSATFPVDYTPPPGTMASLDAFRRWQAGARAFYPAITDTLRFDAYVRDLVDVQPDGAVRLQATDSILDAMYSDSQRFRREYGRIKAPTLAVFADTQIDTMAADSAQRVKNAAWERNRMGPFRLMSLDRLRREATGGVMSLRVPGTHSNFLFTAPDSVAAAMLRFLTK